MYLSRIPSGYVFRRAIPAELRPILGKREFKIALGTDYTVACRRAREEAFRSDGLLDNARARLADQAALSRQPFARYEALPAITTVTEELKQQVYAYWLGLVDQLDLERRANPPADPHADPHADPDADPEDTPRVTLDDLRTLWREGRADRLLPALHLTLLARGYRLELAPEDERRLCLSLLRAALAAHKLIDERDSGEDPPVVLPAAPLPLSAVQADVLNAAGIPVTEPVSTARPAPAAAPGRTPLYDLFCYWRDARRRPQKTVDTFEQHIRALDKLCGYKPAEALVKADIIAYRDARLKCAKSRTVKKDVSFIKAVLQFAVDSAKLPSNPATGVEVQVSDFPTDRFIEEDDLSKLFSSPIYTEDKRPRAGAGDAAAWIPLLALYTGARLEEMAQLRLDDVCTRSGRPCLRITTLEDEGNGGPVQRLKTASSRREIPIPQALLGVGFLDYVAYHRARGASWLFPELQPDAKYGHRGANWGKWWIRWRKKLGVRGSDKCFHAFRHVFKTACRRAGIGEDVHDALTGHTPIHEGRQYGRFPLEALAAIDRVAYPELKFDWVWRPPEERPNAQSGSRSAHRRKAQTEDGRDAGTEPVRVYVDTTFSAASGQASLISLGAVTATGESFYAEVDPVPERCSDLVRETVLPKLTGPALPAPALVDALAKWLAAFPDPELVCDSEWDVRMLRRLIERRSGSQNGRLRFAGQTQLQVTIQKLKLTQTEARTLEEAKAAFFVRGEGERHHALAEARALAWAAQEAEL